ncbi:MAG: DUF4292 domain-containing protein [Candidatus Tectomicrobia bacterium]|uniref:DUF4292 domain-containing protein n=1 Tax=Tectimicrobiota bacterium TaxID=2528274 RepID=A0A932GPY3_UNCTE|nr:DUF4292 domain-containing protein [Candidatus Tectomicrobia bacterium]
MLLKSLFLILLAGLLGACARVELPPIAQVPPSLPFSDSRDLQAALSSQKKILNLTALADFSLVSDGKTVSGKEVILLQGAKAMRLEMLSPFGPPLLILVIRDGRFSAYSVAARRYVRGRANSFNFSRVLGFPLEIEEVNRLIRTDLSGDPEARWGPLGYDPALKTYVVDLHFPEEEGKRRLWIDPARLVVVRAARYDHEGDTILEAELEDYGLVDGILFPRRLVFTLPRKNTRLSLAYGQVTLNGNLDPSLFELVPPQGSRITDLD